MRLFESYNVILTIGIPVYNGARFIQDALTSIVVPPGYENLVEVIVSDNNSTDETEEIVRQFRSVKYFKNSHNMGFDKNVHNIFLKANGEFVWILAADDIVCNDRAIIEVFDILGKVPDLGVIHVGGCQSLESEYLICEKEGFLELSNFKSGAVSSNIIRKNVWLESGPSDFFDSGWIHFGVILKIIVDFKAVLCRNQLTSESPTSVDILKSWDTNGKGLIVVLNLVRIFNNLGNYGYSRAFIKRAKMEIKKNYPKAIIKAKAHGLVVSGELITRFIELYKEFASFWLIDLPSLLISNKLCKFIYKSRNIFASKS